MSTNSTSTATFIEKDGLFEFTVKIEYLKECPEPEQFNHKILCGEKNLPGYLHNPVGPAVKFLKKGVTPREEYWIDGVPLNEEESAKIEKLYKFNNKLTDFIDK